MRAIPLVAPFVVGCAGDEATNDLEFHGELPVLPGFAKKIQAATTCLAAACSTCRGATVAQGNACLSAAETGVCKRYMDETVGCETVFSGPSVLCGDRMTNARLFCGA